MILSLDAAAVMDYGRDMNKPTAAAKWTAANAERNAANDAYNAACLAAYGEGWARRHNPAASSPEAEALVQSTYAAVVKAERNLARTPRAVAS